MSAVFRVKYRMLDNLSMDWNAFILGESAEDVEAFVHRAVNKPLTIDSISREVDRIDGYSDAFIARVRDKITVKPVPVTKESPPVVPKPEKRKPGRPRKNA